MNINVYIRNISYERNWDINFIYNVYFRTKAERYGLYSIYINIIVVC